MALCEYCGKSAGFGRTFHPECKQAAPPPGLPDLPRQLTFEQIQANEIALRLEPVLGRAIFRAIMGAFFAILGICVVLGIIGGVIRSLM